MKVEIDIEIRAILRGIRRPCISYWSSGRRMSLTLIRPSFFPFKRPRGGRNQDAVVFATLSCYFLLKSHIYGLK